MQKMNGIKTIDKKQTRRTNGKPNHRSRLPRISTDHPHIIRVQGLHGGRPIVRGKSVTVQTIVALFRQNLSPEQIVDDYDGVLTLAEVYDALSYYYDHPGEIEQYLAESRAALEKI
jgi:uncharacterized protein (DUF433 family)